MMSLTELPGIRSSDLIGLALEGILRDGTRSAISAVIAALAVAAVIATSGRTVATRETIVADLETPAARLVRVVDRTGLADLSPDVVARIAGLGSVEYVLGLTSAGPLAYNPGLGSAVAGFAGEPVGTRLYWDSVTGGPLLKQVAGRMPSIGEALAGSAATRALHLADHAGSIHDEDRGSVAVVGSFQASATVESLSHYVLIRADADDGPIGELFIVAWRSVDVEPIIAQLPGLLAAEDPTAISIERNEAFGRLRDELRRQFNELDLAVLGGSLAASAMLTAAILFGAVVERRREFGLRRSQGATRSDIGVLVLIQGTLLLLAGSGLGAMIGELVVVIQTGTLPDVALSVAVMVLVTLSGLLGSLPAVRSAAAAEPLYVLRSA